MRQTKWSMVNFAFYDRTGISRWLEQEAEKGWLLEKVSAFGWKFRRIAPQKVHFSVVYFAKASAFDPEPSEKQLSFQDFCEYTGWKLAASNAQMQIFYNEAEDPTPIETDARIELASIHAAAKKTELMSYAILVAAGLMQLVLATWRFVEDPLGVLASNALLFSWGCWIWLLAYTIWQILGYFLWYRKAKKAAETDGSFVETVNHRQYAWLMPLFMAVGMGLMLAGYSDSKMVWITLVSVAVILGVSSLVILFMNYLKKKRVSAKTNLIVTAVVLVIVSFGSSLLILNVVNWRTFTDAQGEQQELETYEYNGITWTVYDDTLPLTIEDLVHTDYEQYSYQLYRPDRSFLLDLKNAVQRPRMDAPGELELSYTIVTVKLRPIYDIAKWAMLKEFARNYGNQHPGDEFWKEARATEAAPWEAEEAYRLYQGGEAMQEYLLCYEDHFVLIRFDRNWNLTEEQMALVGEKLQ